MTSNPAHDHQPPIAFPLAGRRLPQEIIPRPLTALIGRSREGARVQALWNDGVRLVTLIGPGGIGKTRLALELAHAAESRFTAVAWVPLAHAPDSATALAAIADRTGHHGIPDSDIVQTLARALRPTSLLLVLDNLEHLPTLSGPLADLLARCPQLSVLATSRERVRISGEHLVNVQPLPLPEMVATEHEIMQTDAVRLFAARARAVDPDFSLEPANAALVAAICRQLDAVPLAIELAAARLTHLDLATLAARLQQRHPLMTMGGADLPERQRSMANTIGWSVALLTSAEQSLFRRLSVFTGGFTLEAAEAIGAGDALVPVLDLLGRLVERSLVQHQAGSSNASRYHLLESVRAYAASLLSPEEAAAVQERHADWFYAFAQAHRFAYSDPGRDEAMALLSAESANLTAALHWLARREDGDRLLRMSAGLVQFWHARGCSEIEPGFLRAGLALAADSPPAVRSQGMVGLAYLTHRDPGERRRAAQLAAEGLAIDRTIGTTDRIFEDLVMNAVIASYWDELQRAESLALEALALAPQLSDPAHATGGAGDMLHFLGGCARRRGDHRLAIERQAAALEASRVIGDRWLERDALLELGQLEYDRDQPRAALGWYRQCFALPWPSGQPYLDAFALAGAGWSALLLDELEHAARLFGATSTVFRRHGVVAHLPDYVNPIDKGLAQLQERLAPEHLDALQRDGERLTNDEIVALVTWLGQRELPSSLPRQGTVRLTRRETEILPLLAAGMTHRAIGEQLFIGERTVDSHVARLFDKLEVHSRADAIATARHLGLLAS